MNCNNNQNNNNGCGCNCNPHPTPAPEPVDINMSVCDRNINMLPMLQTYTTKVLKPNIDGCCKKNILKQCMMNCENYKYVIKWDFDLDGGTITVPENCILEFDGGSLKNGTIIGQNTVFNNVGDVTIWGENLTREGTWREHSGGGGEQVQSDWDQTDTEAPDYIKNKPTIPQGDGSQFVGRTLAHRGYPYSTHNRFAQDNSLAAIDEAGIFGFTGIECDPRRDVNGVIVLLHDADVSSVSNSQGLIEDLDYRTVFYKDKYGMDTNRRLTTLSEAIAVCKAYNMFMFFDNKGEDGKERSVSITNLREEMEKAGYSNWGVFNYPLNYIKESRFNDVIRAILPQSSLEELNTTLAQFSDTSKVYMRKYTTGKDEVPIEVLRECKRLGIKIVVNYTTEPGTGNPASESYLADQEYINEAWQYYDYFLGDDHIMSGGRTSVGETEGGVIKCIEGALPIPRNLQDQYDASTLTYKEGLWALTNYFLANPRLVTGYISAAAVQAKMPDLKDEFPSGATVLTSLMGSYRSVTAYISGGVNQPKIIVQNIYNDSTGTNEQVSTYELLHDKNISEYLEVSSKNLIAHSADIPSIGTNYEQGQWRGTGDSPDASVVDTVLDEVPMIKRALRLSGLSEAKGVAYEIQDFVPGVYTFSFYIKGSGTVLVSLTDGTTAFPYSIDFSSSENYVRKYVTLNITEDMLYTEDENSILILRIVSFDASTNVDMCGFMLQKGYVLTEWVPKDTDPSVLDYVDENYFKYSNVPAIGINYVRGQWRAIGSNTQGLSVVDATIQSIPSIRKALKVDRQADGDGWGYAYEIDNFIPGKYMLSFYVKGNTDVKINIDKAGTVRYTTTVPVTANYTQVNVPLNISADDLFDSTLLILQLKIEEINKHIEICGMHLYDGIEPRQWTSNTSDYPKGGTTANRPPLPEIGFLYYDTDETKLIVHSGSDTWVNVDGSPLT